MKHRAAAATMVVAAIALPMVSTPTPVFAADQPPAGAAAISVQRNTCETDPNTLQSTLRLKARTTVTSVPNRKNTYYMKITTRADKGVLRNGKYDWSTQDGDITYETAKFLGSQAPTFSTPTRNAAVSGGYDAYSWVVTLRLKQVRKGPDPTRWETSWRTSPVTNCGDIF